LFRESIEIEFISKMYFSCMMALKDKELFYLHNFSMHTLMKQFLEYHLRVISTPKGIEKFSEIINNQSYVMNKRFLIIIITLLPFVGFSQEVPPSFSLQEAIDFALENNRTAVNASRDIKAAEAQKRETIATGLPQINAAVDYQN